MSILINEVSRARRLLLRGMAAGLVGGMWSPRIFAQSDEFIALPKAMWVWLKSLDELGQLSQFALAHGFSALMIHFGKVARAKMRDPESPALRILRDLKLQGCDCFALAGEPQWAQRAELPNAIIELLELQRQHIVFDGLHLDVEPHSLPQWRQPGGSAVLMRGMADLAIRTRDAMPSKMSLQLALNPKHAVQPLADGGSFFGRIAPHVQEVALMAYRDTPRRQLKAANDAAVQLRKLGLPWRMGVLTSSTEEVGVSYYGLPSESFEAQMHELWRELTLERQCQGLSFENYHSMRTMLRSSTTG